MLSLQEKKWLSLWLFLFWASSVIVTHFTYVGVPATADKLCVFLMLIVCIVSGGMSRRIMLGHGI